LLLGFLLEASARTITVVVDSQNKVSFHVAAKVVLAKKIDSILSSSDCDGW
jgi:hypothetical protein